MGGLGGGALAARTAIDRFLDIAPSADHGHLRDAVPRSTSTSFAKRSPRRPQRAR
jgi:hypothetical protein